MLQLQNKFLLILLCALFISSCGFLDLRPIGVNTVPQETDTILPEAFSPVIIKFDTEMMKRDAEGIMQINSDLGSTTGDKYWINNDLYFVPTAGWTAGVRYTLSLLGTIRSIDGRDIKLEQFVSFYAINRNTPPLLIRHSPFNGESVGTNNLVLEFYFSCPMDRLTVESALTIEGIGNKDFEWTAADSVLKVVPEKALSPWVQYQWNLRDTAKSISGVPLPRSYSGYFTTDLDTTLPAVTGVYPVLNAGGRWYPTGANIETGLRHGQGIAVSFNKAMSENVLNSLRFEPSLAGRTEMLSENSIVYIFTRAPDPETTYTMIISGDTRDKSSLKLGSDYRISFVPDIPYLEVLSFTAYGSDAASGPIVIENLSSYNDTMQVRVDAATGEFFFSIHFSLPFEHEEQVNTAQRIILVPHFPKILPPIALQYVNWVGNDRLFMRWEGLNAGTEQIPHYYKLIIPGGRGGIYSTSSAIYMRNDLVFYLEALK